MRFERPSSLKRPRSKGLAPQVAGVVAHPPVLQPETGLDRLVALGVASVTQPMPSGGDHAAAFDQERSHGQKPRPHPAHPSGSGDEIDQTEHEQRQGGEGDARPGCQNEHRDRDDPADQRMGNRRHSRNGTPVRADIRFRLGVRRWTTKRSDQTLKVASASIVAGRRARHEDDC